MAQEEYAEAQVAWIPIDQWEKNMAALKQKGEQTVEEIQKQGHSFQARVLGPREVPAVDPTEYRKFNLAAVVIELDWKVSTKLDMVEDANNFITKAYKIGVLDMELAPVLGAVIEGKGTYGAGSTPLPNQPLYAVVPFQPGSEIQARLESLDTPLYTAMAPQAYFIAYQGTARELAEKIGYNGDPGAGTGIVLPAYSYFGFAPQDLWEWLSTKSKPAQEKS